MYVKATRPRSWDTVEPAMGLEQVKVCFSEKVAGSYTLKAIIPSLTKGSVPIHCRAAETVQAFLLLC